MTEARVTASTRQVPTTRRNHSLPATPPRLALPPPRHGTSRREGSHASPPCCDLLGWRNNARLQSKAGHSLCHPEPAKDLTPFHDAQDAPAAVPRLGLLHCGHHDSSTGPVPGHARKGTTSGGRRGRRIQLVPQPVHCLDEPLPA